MPNLTPPVLSAAVSHDTPLTTTDDHDRKIDEFAKRTSALEATIAAVQAEIRATKQARLQALTETNESHDVLMSRFPLEVCSEIFRWCLPTPERARLDHCTPLLLSSVCRSWRTLAHSTPHLWTTMSLRSTRGRDDERSWTRRGVAFEWLDRSKDLPLTIYLDITPDAGTQRLYVSDEHPERYCFQPLIIRINQESHRLASFWITAPASHVGWIDFRNRGSQLLSELYVKSADYKMDCPHFAECAPWLFELNFYSVSSWSAYSSFLEVGILTRNMTEVRLTSIKWKDLMQILQNSPLLRSCLIHKSVHGAAPWDPLNNDANVVKPPAVTLEHLETLHLTGQSSSAPFTILMELLILPSLTEFKLQTRDYFYVRDAPPVMEQLQAHLERSSAQLSVLYLLNLRFGEVRWGEDEDETICRAIQYSSISPLICFVAPTIRSLFVEACFRSEFHPGEFMQSIVNCGANFPMLHSIEVCCPPPWWLHTLLEFPAASDTLFKTTGRKILLSLDEYKKSAWWNYVLARLLGLPCEDPDKFDPDEEPWRKPLPEPDLPPVLRDDILQLLSSATGDSPRVCIDVPVVKKRRTIDFWPAISEALLKYTQKLGA